MVFYFGQILDHQIAFGEPGHVVLDPTPEPAAWPLVRRAYKRNRSPCLFSDPPSGRQSKIFGFTAKKTIPAHW